MGREPPPPPPPVRDAAGSSSGQKRKAFTMDQDGGSVDTWLTLSLGPVVHDSSVTATTSPQERPPAPVVPQLQQTTVGVLGAAPSTPAADADADADDALAPTLVASALSSVVFDHGDRGALMAAGVLFTGDAKVLPGSSSLQLQRHHESSSARHLPCSTLRRSTASTTSSSGSAGDAPTITGDGANGGDNDDDNGAAGNVNDRVLVNSPYPWATNRVAVHHSLAELSRRGITTIEGEARCRRCDARKVFVYNIAAKFQVLEDYLRRNYMDMNDRAQARWMNPAVPNCDDCGHEKCVRPVIAAEKERINWLFLLLGETLGLCTLDQLKYFCAHTNRHRTGAKDRVLYSTYLELCNQLVPGIIKPFEKKTGHNQLRLR